MPTLDQRIEQETAKIKADSYQSVASLGGWAGGGRTFWSLSVLGAAIGLAIGLIAPFFPLLAGVSSLAIAAKAIPVSMAIFGATGMLTGFSGGLMLGRITGASAAVAQEQEKRLKEWTARQILNQNPQAEILPDAPDALKPAKSFWQRTKDTYRTYVNPRIGLTFATIGALGGLLMAAAFIATSGGAGFAVMPALGALTGLPAETFLMGNAAFNAGALVAYTTGVMATFGALFTVNLPKIASNMSHFFGELLGGKIIGREWAPKEPQKLRSPTQMNYDQSASIVDGSGKQPSRSFDSFQDLLATRAANNPAETLAKR